MPIEKEAMGLCMKGRLIKGLMGIKAFSPSEMAQYAKENTIFYRDLYEGKNPRDFESLPIFKKEMVRDVSPYALLSQRLKDKVRVYGETTGSTGSPTPSFLTSQEFHAATLFAYISPYYALLKKALKENRSCINGLAFGFTIAGMSFGDFMANLGGLVANVGSRSTLATPERIARAIARLKPSLIAGTPIDFLSWMKILREDYPADYPEVVERLKAFLSTAELCSQSRQKQIEKEFGLIHINTYASVEGLFTLACPCGSKHVLEEVYYVELFDENLNKIGPEGQGRLAFTNLLKRSTPMVRYLLDDWVSFQKAQCPYGFKWSIHPYGRYEMMVKIDKKGYNVDDFEEVIFQHGLWGDYEVAIDEERLSLRLERYNEAPQSSLANLARALEERFSLKTDVEVVDLGCISSFRQVRQTKPILKLKDLRPTSTQEIPQVL